MNCMDNCKFMIVRERTDGSTEYSCRLDHRLCHQIRECSAFEPKAEKKEIKPSPKKA